MKALSRLLPSTTIRDHLWSKENLWDLEFLAIFQKNERAFDKMLPLQSTIIGSIDKAKLGLMLKPQNMLDLLSKHIL